MDGFQTRKDPLARVVQKVGMKFVRSDVDEHNFPTEYYALTILPLTYLHHLCNLWWYYDSGTIISGHAVHAATYAAKAATYAADPTDADADTAMECNWQFQHLLALDDNRWRRKKPYRHLSPPKS